MQLAEKRSPEIFTRDALGIVVEMHGSAPSIRNVTIGTPLADEVVVRNVASGICHTDLLAADGRG